MDAVLVDVLSHYPESLQPTGPFEALGNAGGRSGASLWRYPSRIGPRLIRLWPERDATVDRVQAIHSWLGQARGIPCIPQPAETRQREAMVVRSGRIWQVEPWMPGVALPASHWHPEMLAAAVRRLGELHLCLRKFGRSGRSPGVLARLSELRNLRAGGLVRLQRCVDSFEATDERELALRWCAWAHPRIETVEAALLRVMDDELWIQPCLRDCRAEHFLWVDAALVGLVDFGAMDFDTPILDLSRLWLEGDATWRAGLMAEYQRLGTVESSSLRLLRPLADATGLLIGHHWIRWHFEEQRGLPTEMVRSGLRRSLGWLSRSD